MRLHRFNIFDLTFKTIAMPIYCYRHEASLQERNRRRQEQVGNIFLSLKHCILDFITVSQSPGILSSWIPFPFALSPPE